MPPNMSFALTPRQYQEGSKSVTRRDGWRHIKIGGVYNGVNKVMGFKKGEKPIVYGQHKILSARWEPLRRMIDEPEYGAVEVVLEGFPEMTPLEFVDFYCRHSSKRTPDMPVHRIEFMRILSCGHPLSSLIADEESPYCWECLAEAQKMEMLG